LEGWVLKRFVLMVVVSLLLPACSEESFIVPQREVPVSLLTKEQTFRSGHNLFLQYCRECHGSLNEGRNQRAARFIPPAPDFHELYYSQSDPAYLFWRIEEGKRVEPFRSRGSVMPAWKPHFTEEQIWQLVAYLKQRSLSRR